MSCQSVFSTHSHSQWTEESCLGWYCRGEPVARMAHTHTHTHTRTRTRACHPPTHHPHPHHSLFLFDRTDTQTLAAVSWLLYKSICVLRLSSIYFLSRSRMFGVPTRPFFCSASGWWRVLVCVCVCVWHWLGSSCSSAPDGGSWKGGFLCGSALRLVSFPSLLI